MICFEHFVKTAMFVKPICHDTPSISPFVILTSCISKLSREIERKAKLV
jgi:hypothetical protein